MGTRSTKYLYRSKGIVFINGARYPAKDSIWANPFKIGKDGPKGADSKGLFGDRTEVIQKYESYIRNTTSRKN
jgi:hypothetical protein